MIVNPRPKFNLTSRTNLTELKELEQLLSAAMRSPGCLFLFNIGDPVPLDGQELVDLWGLSDTYSTRWTQGRRVGQRRREMCAGAGSPPHHRRSGSRHHNLKGPRCVADGVKAQWPALCCCDEPPRSCCSGRAPRRLSSCRSTHVWGLICRLCPQHTWRGGYRTMIHYYVSK